MAEVAVQTKKVQLVEDLRGKLLGSRVIALANVSGIPGPQMQRIRAKLRGKVELQVVKNRLLLRAIGEAARDREGIDGLQGLVEGQVALVLTDSNPFRLFKELEATKTKAPAKGGEVAPGDIVVQEGDTPFKPGPVVGDLQRAGIPAAIEKGKVVIKKEKLLVEKGKRIPVEVAQAIARLGIFPMTVGLDIRGVFEDGTLFTRDVLAVDEEAIRRDLATAAGNALRLSMGLAFPTRATIAPLLADAHRRALSLGMVASYPTKELIPLFLSRAHGQLMTLASRVPDALDDELRALIGSPPKVEEPKKEEPKKEEPKKEEPKKEEPKKEEERAPKKEEKDSDDEEEAAAGLGSLFG